jgi:chromosome segregation protein
VGEAHRALIGAEDELQASTSRLAAAERAAGEITRRLAQRDAGLAALETALATADQELDEVTRLGERLEDETQRHAQTAARAASALAAMDVERALAEAEHTKLDERWRSLVERAAREVGELPPAAEGAVPSAALAERLAALQVRLTSLGPVNQVALQEHAEVTERITFLRAQLDDLNGAEQSLLGASADLENGVRRDFERTFEAVAEHFGAYVCRLFGGGDGRLALTDPTNLVETGVEIIVQLPGKRRRELALLSGGERALVAAALLFALLKARPSPFCVMDEVDAALDDASIGRFGDVLQELSALTQFVIITHNRSTMERAGALYGVTLGADGVSRVVSLRLHGSSDGSPAGTLTGERREAEYGA